MAFERQFQGMTNTLRDFQRRQQQPGQQQPSGPSPFFTPNNPFQGAQSYDTSLLQRGVGAVENASRGISVPQFNPMQYTAPNVSAVGSRNIIGGPSVTGRMQSAGPYGTSTPGEVSSAYMTGFGAAASPIMSQGKERMRGLVGQGFGRTSGGAAKQLALRSAQQTGSDLQDLGSNIGGQISQRMLGQQETARGQDYNERQNINQDYQRQLRERDTGAYAERTQAAGENRDDEISRRNMQYQAELNRQQQQDASNYQAAGFNAAQAQYNSNLAMQGALAQMQGGFRLPELQASLYGQNLQGWQQMMGLQNPTTAGAYA